MKQSIQTMTGNETVADALAKVHLFHVQEKREDFLSAAAKMPHGRVRSQGSPVFESAVAGVRQEIGGRWVRAVYDVEEGEILKLYVSRKGGWGEQMRACVLFLRVRQHAALRRVSIPLLNVPNKSRFERADITGRFDVLTAREVMGAGCAVSHSSVMMSARSAVDNTLSIAVLEEETTSSPKTVAATVAVEGGESKVIRVRRRVRRMEFNS
jgi:hypothetical protein